MKSFVRKTIISILSLIFSISILGTVTLAWFTLASTNVIENISLKFAAESFEISLDGINYYNIIETNMIQSKIPADLGLRHVSSNDGKDFYTRELGSDLTAAMPNKDYLSIPFYFRTIRRETSVYLVENVSGEVVYDQVMPGTYVVSRGVYWTSNYRFRYSNDEYIEKGEGRKFFASDAIRIGFIEEKILSQDTRSDAELRRTIFDLSKNPERGYGEEFGGLDYYNIYNDMNIKPPHDKPNTIYELTQFMANRDNIALNNNSKILEMIESNELHESGVTYFIGKATLNIWIEGWDADCFDAIFKDMVRIQLKFKIGKL